MEIKVSTVYTKDRLVRFNRFYAAQKKFFWILLAVCTAIIIFDIVLLALLDALTETIIFSAFMVFIVDVMSVITSFVLPNATVKKSPSIDAKLEYSFTEDSFVVSAEAKNMSDSVTIKYPALVSVAKKEDVYLFISKRQCYIVDISSLTDLEILALKSLVTSHLSPKKVKWK